MKKLLFIILGSITFIFGTLGVFVPVLPTTPFYLATVFFWLNSSDKLLNYFIQTTYYQTYIKEMIVQKKMTKSNQRKMFIGIFVLLAIPFILVKSLPIKLVLIGVFMAHLLLLSHYFNRGKNRVRNKEEFKKN